MPTRPVDQSAVRATDLALAAGLVGVAVLSGLFIDAARPDTTEPSQWWHWALIVVPPLLVAVRRVDPIVVTILATVAQCLIWVADLPEVLLPILVVIYTAAETSTRGVRVAVGASVALSVVTAVGVRVAGDVTVYQLPLVALTCGVAILLGRTAARQRDAAHTLAVEITEQRLRNERERSDAVTAERTHIARELHDIVGHTLSVIAVRAEAADRVSDEKPEASSSAVAAIAVTARSALAETRRVLAGLRDADGIGGAALSPAADLEAIRQLVRVTAQAGVDVTLHENSREDVRTPAIVAAGAYRIVQESLTNAVKHGGHGVAIQVEITCSARDMVIEVGDNGVGAARSRDATPGSGIAAMSERAAVLGGTLSARARPDGGFVVHASLPFSSE